MFTTLALLIALAGCSSFTGKSTDTGTNPSGTQEPDLALACDAEQTSFTRDQDLLLGFTAAELMASIAGTTGLTGRYTDGTTTDVDITIVDGEGPVVFSERFVAGTDIKDEICFDLVAVPITLLVTSADGAFNFDLPASLNARATGVFTIGVEAQVSDNRGSHSIAITGDETGSYGIAQVVTDDDVQGSIDAFIEGASGDVVYVSREAVISWPEGE